MENLKAWVSFPGCLKCKLKGSRSDYGKITEPCAAFVEEDLVNHPSHYSSGGGIECIDAIRACLSKEEYEGFCQGNFLKYAWRFKQKGGTEDLDKAAVYLKWLKESYAKGNVNG